MMSTAKMFLLSFSGGPHDDDGEDNREDKR